SGREIRGRGRSSMRRGPTGRALLAVVAIVGGGVAPPSASAADTWTTVPKAHCQPGDPVETGLQGQVPRADRTDGRAARGYGCNLRLVGRYAGAAFASFDTYGRCAYYS